MIWTKRLARIFAGLALVGTMGIDATAIADTCASGHSIGVDISGVGRMGFRVPGSRGGPDILRRGHPYQRDHGLAAILRESELQRHLHLRRRDGLHGDAADGSHSSPGTNAPEAGRRCLSGRVPLRVRSPLAVPRRDTLAAYFVSNPCGDTFNLFRAKDTQYTAGSLWRTWRGGQVCGLRPNPEHLPNGTCASRSSSATSRHPQETIDVGSLNSATDERAIFGPATRSHAASRTIPRRRHRPANGVPFSPRDRGRVRRCRVDRRLTRRPGASQPQLEEDAMMGLIWAAVSGLIVGALGKLLMKGRIPAASGSRWGSASPAR